MRIIRIILVFTVLLFFQRSFSQKTYSVLINDPANLNPAGISTVNSFQVHFKTFDLEFDKYYRFEGYLNTVLPINAINSHIGADMQFYQENDFVDSKIGLSYSYKKSFSKDSYLALGTKISVFSVRESLEHEIYNSAGYAVIEIEEEKLKSDILNIDIGFWFQGYNLGVGLIYNHLNNPLLEISSDYNNENKLIYYYDYDPEINAMIDYRFYFLGHFEMYNSVFAYDLKNIVDPTDKVIELNMNNIFELNKTFMFGTAWEYLKIYNEEIRLFSMLGFNLNDKYKVMVVFPMKYFRLEDGINYKSSKRYRSEFECSIYVNL